MAITITKYPNNYSFTGNPVVFEVSTGSDDPVNVEISIGEKTYSTTYYPFMISEDSYKISMNLSDYLHFENKENIPEDGIISVIPGFAQSYQVKIGDNYTFNGFALRGGISNQAFRKLDENGYNIFTYRLTSLFDQFLFTTRTNGKEIRIKETELFPFVFRHPGVPIVFRSESGNEITTPAQAAGTFCTMNIPSVLEQMPEGTQRIEVYINGKYAFHFIILTGKLSEERYLLKFRNSLGAFEVLEVTGKAMNNPTFSEETLWESLTELNFYEENRSRVKSRGAIDVETGYKERYEFPFVLDMIQSDEIYFIYPDGDSFRCYMKADSAQFRHLMTEPTSIKLNIRAVTDEEFVTPKIEFPPEIIYPVLITVDTSISASTRIRGLAQGYQIDWGDGNVDISNNDITHTYNTVGIFKISISGDNFSDIIPVNFLNSQVNVTNIVFGFKPTVFSTSCFEDCTGLIEVVFSSANLTIGSYAFKNCSSLSGDMILTGIVDKGIKTQAFYGCSNLNSITLSSGDKFDNATECFRECSSLIGIYGTEIHNTVYSGMFNNCTSLKNITLADDVTTIGNSAFYACSSLTDINTHLNLSYIGTSAFRGCSSLTGTFYIRNISRTEDFGYGAFYNCSSLVELDFRGSTATSFIEPGFDWMGGIAAGCTSLEKVELPVNFQRIGTGMFTNCKSLIEIVNLDNVTYIGLGAFSGCINIPFHLNLHLTDLKENAFQFCESAISYDFRNSTFTRLDSDLSYHGIFRENTIVSYIGFPNTLQEIAVGTLQVLANESLIIEFTSISPPEIIPAGGQPNYNPGVNGTFPSGNAGYRVKVPASSISAYKLAWPEIENRIIS